MADKVPKNTFTVNQQAEREFARALKRVAQESGRIVEGFTSGAQVRDMKAMMKALEDYARIITPWATKQAAKLIETVNRSNARSYRAQSEKIAKLLRSGVAEQNVGKSAIALINEQVGLIKSLPIEAGLRAQNIAVKNYLAGIRATPDPETVARFIRERQNSLELFSLFQQQSGLPQFKEEMERTTQVAVNRAKLIARTEAARTNQAFTQARSVALGAKGYIWRTTMDGAERESHAKMNGKYVEFDKPPRLSDGTVTHAGAIYNCRCWQQVVLPPELTD